MSIESIVERLDDVPVYALMNVDKEFVLLSGSRMSSSMGLLSFRKEDVATMLDQGKVLDRGRREGNKVVQLAFHKTPESKMEEEATSDRLKESIRGLNLRIYGLLNRDEFSKTELMKMVKKRMGGKSVVNQQFSLDLLESCVMNYDKVFSVVALEKVLEEMVKMIESMETEDGNRWRAWQLIDMWGKSEDLEYLPVFKKNYMLKLATPTLQKPQV